MTKKINILGAGIAGLSCASFMAQAGHDVTIFEKNDSIGGRARKFDRDGFLFDMGPSWYWMPDVFERFYQKFGHTTSDFYDLKRLDPSYRIFWEDESITDVPANLEEMYAWFESMETGSAAALKKFLKEAAYKYEVGMQDLVYKPGLNWGEFMDWRVMKGFFNLHLTTSFSKYIRTYFKHPKILSLLEFPVLFLGAMPKNTPALYSLMNYADINLGTWYPMGGMHKIIEAFEQIAREQGVKIELSSEVTGLQYAKRQVTNLHTSKGYAITDVLISSADYHHTDRRLLAEDKANYTEKYWDKRDMAPSCLLFYVGVNKKIENLQHHNLFFDTSFEQHAKEIYDKPGWPTAPLFYVCCPSKTDPATAPDGKENLFLLIPLAPDLKDDLKKREEYLDLLISRIEKQTGTSFKSDILFHQSYCIDDFKKDYHAYKGNAYGLANTLRQTAVWKPKIKNKNLDNFYYTGQLTVPGPGVPPSIISGEVVARQVLKELAKNQK